MEHNDKTSVIIRKRTLSAIKHIDRAISTLEKTRERLEYGTPDHTLATNILGSLNEARQDAVITAKRNGVRFDSNDMPIVDGN